MSLRLIGLTVEKKLLVVPGNFVISPPSCDTDPTDCCSGSGPDTIDCCTGLDVAAAIGFAFDGPLNSDRSNATVSGTLDRLGDAGLLYQGPSVGGDIGADIILTAYCVGTIWRAQGVITLSDYPAPIYYDTVLTPFDGFLLAVIEVPDQNSIYLAVADPCPSGPVPVPSCVPTCSACPDGASSAWALTLNGITATVTYVSPTEDDIFCQWVSGDGRWVLYYNETTHIWNVSDADTSTTWTLPGTGWNCIAINTLTSTTANDLYAAPINVCGTVVPADGCVPTDVAVCLTVQDIFQGQVSFTLIWNGVDRWVWTPGPTPTMLAIVPVNSVEMFIERIPSSGFCVLQLAVLGGFAPGTSRWIWNVFPTSYAPFVANWNLAANPGQLINCDGACDSFIPNFYKMVTGTCGTDCTPVAGWAGPGWYCFSPGSGAPCAPVLLNDASKCSPSLVICSGPYPDETTAAVGCVDNPNPCCDGPSTVDVQLVYLSKTWSGSITGGFTGFGFAYSGSVTNGTDHLSVQMTCVSGQYEFGVAPPGPTHPFTIILSTVGGSLTGTNTFVPAFVVVQAPCPTGTTPSYNCATGLCSDPGDGTGAYSTLGACTTACTAPTPGATCAAAGVIALDQVITGTMPLPAPTSEWYVVPTPGTGLFHTNCLAFTAVAGNAIIILTGTSCGTAAFQDLLNTAGECSTISVAAGENVYFQIQTNFTVPPATPYSFAFHSGVC